MGTAQNVAIRRPRGSVGRAIPMAQAYAGADLLQRYTNYAIPYMKTNTMYTDMICLRTLQTNRVYIILCLISKPLSNNEWKQCINETWTSNNSRS